MRVGKGGGAQWIKHSERQRTSRDQGEQKEQQALIGDRLERSTEENRADALPP
jgi:hypothetical protein